MTGTERILVIKLGALGDFVQALGPMAAIRRHHPNAEITLLTTRPFAALGEACPWVDRVWIDERPGSLDLGGWWRLRRRLRGGGFSQVYDLQTSGRSGRYFRLFLPGPMPRWSGIAAGCSHPHANPGRDTMHTIERQAEQLAAAGIDMVPAPDVSWVEADVGRFGVAAPYALLVPGGAPHRPAKRWPAERFAELAVELAGRAITPVVLGTGAEAAAARTICAACPQAIDLIGRTDLADIAVLARGAVAAVGNDTGPMHLIATAGCPSVVAFSRESDPALCGQRGPAVRIVRVDDLSGLQVQAVLNALAEIVPSLDAPIGAYNQA